MATAMRLPWPPKSLTFHLKDGTQVTIDGVSLNASEEILAWLKAENPSLRWGPYDDSDLGKA